MKKIMIAVAIVCATVCANAASVAWGFGSAETVAPDGIYFGEGGYSDATAFLFSGTVSAGSTGWNIGTATILDTATMDSSNFNWGRLDVSSTAGMLSADAAAGDPITLILLDGSVGNSIDAFKNYKGNYIISSVNTLTADSIPGTTPVPYLSGIDPNAYTATDWTATPEIIPEPTSGLLLLLGMAGLALKRKIA